MPQVSPKCTQVSPKCAQVRRSAPKVSPQCNQVSPKCTQGRPKWAPSATKWAPSEPMWAPYAPDVSPKRATFSVYIVKKRMIVLGAFFVRFRCVLGTFFVRFCWYFDAILFKNNNILLISCQQICRICVSLVPRRIPVGAIEDVQTTRNTKCTKGCTTSDHKMQYP